MQVPKNYQDYLNPPGVGNNNQGSLQQIDILGNNNQGSLQQIDILGNNNQDSLQQIDILGQLILNMHQNLLF